MRIRIAALTAIAALSLGAAACTQAEQDQAEADAGAAADKAGDIAAQTGEVLEAGAMKAAQEWWKPSQRRGPCSGGWKWSRRGMG